MLFGSFVQAFKAVGLRGAVRNNLAPTRAITTVIMGPPGGGKGTISKRLVKDLSYHHISTGDMLRQHVNDATPLGLKAKEYMDVGGLVPDDVMVGMVAEELAGSAHPHVLLDGFPRTVEQAKQLSKSVHVDVALNLAVPFEDIVKRISGRWTHPASGRVYSYDFNPPKEEGKDDETGEALIQRDDDKPDAVMKRLDAYQTMTQPLIGHYQELEVLTVFDGEEEPDLIKADRRSDAIYKGVKPFLERRHAQ